VGERIFRASIQDGVVKKRKDFKGGEKIRGKRISKEEGRFLEREIFLFLEGQEEGKVLGREKEWAKPLGRKTVIGRKPPKKGRRTHCVRVNPERNGFMRLIKKQAKKGRKGCRT